MKTFKQYLFEMKFPGGYYDNISGRLIKYFNNKQEKEKYDDAHEKDNRDLVYRSDRDTKLSSAKTKALLGVSKGIKAAGNVISKVNVKDVIDNVNQQVFGDSVISQKAVDSIRDINEIRKELDLTRKYIEKLDKQIQIHRKNIELIKKLKEKRAQQLERWKQLRDKKNAHERYYNN